MLLVASVVSSLMAPLIVVTVAIAVAIMLEFLTKLDLEQRFKVRSVHDETGHSKNFIRVQQDMSNYFYHEIGRK